MSLCALGRLLSASSRLSLLRRRSLRPAPLTTARPASSDAATPSDEPAPRPKAPFFFSSQVQTRLKYLTGLDSERVFRVSKRGQQIPAPTYQFVTEDELRELRAETQRKAERKLQMPPVMDERQELDDAEATMEEDPAILGYDAARIVFTDITYGVHDRDRLVVVREPEGRLRKATWDERDRLNQIYFPREGRKMEPPPMLRDEAVLESLLGPEKYEYILDRCCVQLEPDHPMFIRTNKKVFEHIDEHGHYEVLQSTRHYGPMVFHLVWERRCDDLIVYYLQEKRSLSEAAAVVHVFRQLHPDSSVGHRGSQNEDADAALDDAGWLRLYGQEDAAKGGKVIMAVEAYLEREEQERLYARGVDAAHGRTTTDS